MFFENHRRWKGQVTGGKESARGSLNHQKPISTGEFRGIRSLFFMYDHALYLRHSSRVLFLRGPFKSVAPDGPLEQGGWREGASPHRRLHQLTLFRTTPFTIFLESSALIAQQALRCPHAIKA